MFLEGVTATILSSRDRIECFVVLLSDADESDDSMCNSSIAQCLALGDRYKYARTNDQVRLQLGPLVSAVVPTKPSLVSSGNLARPVSHALRHIIAKNCIHMTAHTHLRLGRPHQFVSDIPISREMQDGDDDVCGLHLNGLRVQLLGRSCASPISPTFVV